MPALLICYYFPKLRKHRKYTNAVLLIFSLGFYTWGEPVFVFVMILSAFFNWGIGRLMERFAGRKKLILTIGVVFDVGLLAVFKYASFLSENLAKLTGNEKLIVSIALPIGISFFTFQEMSYIFDVYYGTIQSQKNPLYVLLYISLFPQLIAGPIVRYSEIETEITDRKESFIELSEGMRRFTYGLGKKVLLANFMAQVADNVFDYLDSRSVMIAWYGAVAYTLQIYFDFSGYSDMAIGLGRMFGFHFPENFNYPYIARSVTDFWRRWHITLTSWFRSYVYIPMGGNRVKKSRWVLNLFVVWLLTGIWHGANWTFIFWGLFYFVILLVEKLTGFEKRLGILGHIYTLVIVTVAWVMFRSPDILSGLRYIGEMFGIGASGFWDAQFTSYLKSTYVILIFSLIGVTPLFWKVMGWRRRKENIDNTAEINMTLEQSGGGIIESLWVLLIFILSLLQVISSTYNPFIYFNF